MSGKRFGLGSVIWIIILFGAMGSGIFTSQYIMLTKRDAALDRALETAKHEHCQPTNLIVTDSDGKTNRVFDCADITLIGVNE